MNRFFSPSTSSEPAVPGDDEDAAAVSPEPEAEVEKEAEAAVTELKAEAMLETQTDLHTSEELSEKNHAAPPAAEATTGPSEAATAAPEENRVGPDLPMTSGPRLLVGSLSVFAATTVLLLGIGHQ